MAHQHAHAYTAIRAPGDLNGAGPAGTSGDHDHEHDHGHGHGHHHGHHHPSQPSRLAWGLAIALNGLFVAVEFTAGWLSHSTALVADAGHNLSDVLGLLLAGGAAVLARQAPAGRYTYGWRGSSILAALANAILLLVACGAIGWEAVQRLVAPPAVEGLTVTWVAAVGLVVNAGSALLFVRHRSHDLNTRGAYLHLAADAAVSLGVVISGLVVAATGWYALDPAVSLAIVAVIVSGTWGLLRESMQLALSAVPAHIDLHAVETHLRHCPGVTDVHDLHVWGLSTTENALTVHLVMPQGHPGDGFVDRLVGQLRHQFAVHHATLQVEQGYTCQACCLGGPRAADSPPARAADRADARAPGATR
jgi:cobalt-zinc-cadmium efflux system protein